MELFVYTYAAAVVAAGAFYIASALLRHIANGRIKRYYYRFRGENNIEYDLRHILFRYPNAEIIVCGTYSSKILPFLKSDFPGRIRDEES